MSTFVFQTYYHFSKIHLVCQGGIFHTFLLGYYALSSGPFLRLPIIDLIWLPFVLLFIGMNLSATGTREPKGAVFFNGKGGIAAASVTSGVRSGFDGVFTAGAIH